MTLFFERRAPDTFPLLNWAKTFRVTFVTKFFELSGIVIEVQVGFRAQVQVCVSYIVTRNLVFRSNISHAKGMMRYISLAVINYLVNITIIPLLVTFSVNYLIAKIFVVGGMFIFNFIIGSNFIFTNLNSSRDS